MLVADDGDLRRLRQELPADGVDWELQAVSDLGALAAQLDRQSCDAVLAGASVPTAAAARLVAEVRARQDLLPVVIVVPAERHAEGAALLKAGASAVVPAGGGWWAAATVREADLAAERQQARQRERWTTTLAQVAQDAPSALALASADGVVRWANGPYLALAGATRADLEDGRLTVWTGEGRLPPDVREVLRRGEVWVGLVNAPLANGAAATHELRVSAVEVPGHPSAWFAVSRRDAGAGAANEAFLTGAAQRAELFAAIAGGIAHDLNNVLAPVAMAVGLLRDQLQTEDAVGLLDTIEHSAERGAAVIRQVLTFARGGENCRMILQPRFVFQEVARLAAEVFPPNIQVRADIPGHLWPVVGDPGAIHQALVSVLVNARDALVDGGRISITARNAQIAETPDLPFFDARPGEYVMLTIEDSGPGLPAELMHRIWEPFATTRAEGQPAGLGLSMVAGVVRSHGGFAQVRAPAGRGTVVSLFFPKAVEEAIRTVVAPAPAEPGRILVVDDEETILELSRRILERAGYEVVTAHDGHEALALFMRQRAEISMVLTDLSMPGMNGFTLIWALRRSKPDLRVAVATGQGTDANLRELERMGVREAILKPFSSRRLLEAVTRALAEPPVCEPDLFVHEQIVA